MFHINAAAVNSLTHAYLTVIVTIDADAHLGGDLPVRQRHHQHGVEHPQQRDHDDGNHDLLAEHHVSARDLYHRSRQGLLTLLDCRYPMLCEISKTNHEQSTV